MRFVSWNTQYCTGLDGRCDVARIAAGIIGADVVCLQEVDRHWQRSGDIDQATAIAELMPGFHWAYGAGVDLDASTTEHGLTTPRRRQFGNMVLSRWPLLSLRNHLLPKHAPASGMSLQRSALETTIGLPDGPCRVISTHLAHADEFERENQVGTLRFILTRFEEDGGVISGFSPESDWAPDVPQEPPARRTVLAGDFNFEPRSPLYGRIADGEQLIDSWTAGGHPVTEGATAQAPPEGGHERRIDYVFVSPEFADQIAETWIGTDTQGSDHRPVWVDFSLGASTARDF